MDQRGGKPGPEPGERPDVDPEGIGTPYLSDALPNFGIIAGHAVGFAVTSLREQMVGEWTGPLGGLSIPLPPPRGDEKRVKNDLL